LNAGGEIIGGDWLSKDRPDFLWTVKPPVFKDPYYKNIYDLYSKSLNKETALSELNGLKLGDFAYHDGEKRALGRVAKIQQNGLIHLVLSNGSVTEQGFYFWNVKKALQQYDGISIGAEVYVYEKRFGPLKTGKTRKKAAAFLSDGTLIVDDGNKYPPRLWKNIAEWP
jgi:hypothetical protein